MKKIRTFGAAALVLLWAALTLGLWFGERSAYTNSERRALAQMPEFTANSLFSGKFSGDFEEFTLDQFPLRDGIRQVKALFHYYGLNQSDNNGIYLVGDQVAKLEYPLNTASLEYTAGRFQYVYDTWLRDSQCKLYATLIPDKGCYLAEANGYPALDYAAMEAAYREATAWAAYVDIGDLLSGEDYYRTDTHWRQENLLEVAQRLCRAMGVRPPAEEDYTPVKLEKPFYGVYFGQAALPMAPEEMYVMESPLLEACAVSDPITGKTTAVYDMQKLESPDLYDVFLSGAQPILQVENPQGSPDRELVIFRDSFGSSLAPLLVSDYSRVTLVDIRYISPDQIGNYVNFQDQDVLFAYSSLILNNGRSLK